MDFGALAQDTVAVKHHANLGILASYIVTSCYIMDKDHFKQLVA